MKKEEKKKNDLRTAIFLAALLGIALGLMLGANMQKKMNSETNLKEGECMELLMFQINVTGYAAGELGLTFNELMDEYVSYKTEEILNQ